MSFFLLGYRVEAERLVEGRACCFCTRCGYVASNPPTRTGRHKRFCSGKAAKNVVAALRGADLGA